MINLLIPMAGEGQRFIDAGYTMPKPFIDVQGLPMVVRVITEANLTHCRIIFLVKQDHICNHNAHRVLTAAFPHCEIVPVHGTTQGAACTTLLASDLINNSDPLIIMNCDQIIHWDAEDHLKWMLTDPSVGGIATFLDTERSPKWSFAKVRDGWVECVAEKEPISDLATVGIYVWKKGQDYVKYAKQMITNNIRTNNEFYVCPVFNEAIKDGKKIRVKNVDSMHGIGTPEDLQNFLTNKGFNQI